MSSDESNSDSDFEMPQSNDFIRNFFNRRRRFQRDTFNFKYFSRNLLYNTSCNNHDAIETFIYVWCENYSSKKFWPRMSEKSKIKAIQDMLNTLYCISYGFDAIFVLLFTNLKSRNLLLQSKTNMTATNENLFVILKDVFKYASMKGFKYVNCQKEEYFADFPLKSFGLCSCTKRPLYVATYMGRPDVVHILLTHGATIHYDDVCNCGQIHVHPLINVMRFLNAYSQSRSKITEISQAIRQREEKDVLSLRMLLVDIPHSNELWTPVREQLLQLNETSTEIFPSLKHISRTKIRDYVRKGCYSTCDSRVIEKLSLPKILKSYLNMEHL